MPRSNHSCIDTCINIHVNRCDCLMLHLGSVHATPSRSSKDMQSLDHHNVPNARTPNTNNDNFPITQPPTLHLIDLNNV